MDPTLSELADLAGRPDALIDLDQGALLISALFQPDLDRGRHLRRLDSLAEIAAERVPARGPVPERAAAFHQFLFMEQGFTGNAQDFEDPRNSFLDQVMERRLGIPISLSVLYCEVARRIDLPAMGVGFPGHFIVRVGTGGEGQLVDPFSGGAVLDTDELDRRLSALYGPGSLTLAANPALLRPARNRDILVRMLRNLKTVYLGRGDVSEALMAACAILALAPEVADEWRDRGLIYRELGHASAALSDLRRFTQISDDAQAIAAVAPIIDELEHRPVLLH